MTLKKTPLDQSHRDLNAKMVPFSGWDMPVQYDSIISEYHQTRQASAIFDISHMGEFIIEGDLESSGLDKIVTMPLKDLPIKKSRYGMMLNENGGVIDDLIVFRMEEEKWFLVVNAGTVDKDEKHIQKYLSDTVTFKNVSQDLGKIDLQGPLAREVLKTLIPDISRLTYFAFDFFDCLGENVLVSRTGYTGELGYEIFYPWSKTQILWDALLKDDRVKAAGLGARDQLRLECGYSLYGHEITEDGSPLEAGLKRFIDFEKDFIGKEVLQLQMEKGLDKKLIGLVSHNRRSPRENHNLYDEKGVKIGCITSGTFSPSLEKGIALGFVESQYSEIGKNIYFGDDRSKNLAMISKKIFYDKGSVKD